MDEAVIKYYRQLLKEEFPNSGALENPSIFVEAVGEKLINCGNTGNYMQLYLKVMDRRIVDIRYLCSCEPVANVAVEVLCTLVKGKTVAEAVKIKEDSFYQVVGSRAEALRKKVVGVIELLKEGITSFYPTKSGDNKSDDQGGKLSWDEPLSS